MGQSESKLQGFGQDADPAAVEEECQRRQEEKTPAVWLWCPDQTCWIKNGDDRPVLTGRSTLRFVTYNVWFDEHRFEARRDALFLLLRDSHADVIGLQEVLPALLESLIEQSWVKEDFIISDTTGGTLGSYGVVMLVRRTIHVAHFSLVELDSLMGRHVLVCSIDFEGEPMLLSTVHLESLNSSSVRKVQLGTIWRLLDHGSGKHHAVLMGDFNFSDGHVDETFIEPQYVDVWKHLHPGDAGITMRAHDHYEAWRPDHGLVRSNSTESSFVPLAAEVIGKDPIGPCEECNAKGLDCLLSDHYGLLFELGMSGCQR